MNIKSAITTEGMPVKIIPFSPEMLASECKQHAFQDILIIRMQAFYNTQDYIELQEKFKSVCSAILEKAPECEKLIRELDDDAVVPKETEAFDAGYKAGMNDLMTALTFNDLQIINTQLCDMKAIAEKREAML